MRKLTNNDIRVLRLLKTGADHKITRRQLEEKTKLSTRNLFDSIEVLRSQGIPIMASRKPHDAGYYIAKTEAEKKQGIAQYKQQLATEQHNLELLEKANVDNYLLKADDQIGLWNLLGSDMLTVKPTKDGAIIQSKRSLKES